MNTANIAPVPFTDDEMIACDAAIGQVGLRRRVEVIETALPKVRACLDAYETAIRNEFFNVEAAERALHSFGESVVILSICNDAMRNSCGMAGEA